MKLFVATAVPAGLVGDEGRRVQLNRALHKGRADLNVEFKKLCAKVKGLISTRERCVAFLRECVEEGLVVRGLRRWKPGSAPLFRWEKYPDDRVPRVGPGSGFIKVMVKHRGK